MTSGKNSSETINFMKSFHEVREGCSNDPNELENITEGDDELKDICIRLYFVACTISSNEKRYPQMFTAPVDPKFIEQWRDYEERYAGRISSIFLSDLGVISKASANDNSVQPKTKYEIHWDNANDEAIEQTSAISNVITFANEQIDQDHRDFPEDFVDQISMAVSTWEDLNSQTGLDIQGIFRRRMLVPFVNIPTRVANLPEASGKNSLLTLLQEAHNAFVFGAPLAALAVMRAVLEKTLVTLYGATKGDLKDKIEIIFKRQYRCRLPRNLRAQTLDDLRKSANEVLHLNPNKKEERIAERELLEYLLALRDLIERAPT